MKRLRKLAVTVFLIGLAISLQAQYKEFKYTRSIDGTHGLWNRLLLPDDLYSKVKPDLSDLRIIGVNPGGDTVEAPFLIRHKEDELISREVPTRILNQSRQGELFYFTVEIQKPSTINQLTLDFEQSNFDWRILLEGSSDGRQWFRLLDNYRVLGIKNNWTAFNYSQLNFPTSNYGFYRLGIKTNEKPILKNVRLSLEDKKEGTLKNYRLDSFQIHHDRAGKESVLTFTLPYKVPVSMVRLFVRDTIDYFRPVTISALTDSVQTEKGWYYNYEQVYAGTLHSLQNNSCWLKHILLQKGKIEINNTDNQPLRIDSIQVQGYETELVVRISEPADYALYYGDKELGKPAYDIANFTQKIPDSLHTLPLGKEILIGKMPTAPAPLFESKQWLWAIMLVLIILMGWFTISMLRKKSVK